MFKKLLRVFVVVAGMVATLFLISLIDLEAILREKEEPISLSQIELADLDACIGKPAGSDIERIQDQERWEELSQNDRVSVDVDEIVSTGWGRISHWVDPYEPSTKNRWHNRKKPVFIRESLDFLDEYSEYYLLRLKDGSYILAQISEYEAKALERKKSNVLPIGKKINVATINSELQKICENYNVISNSVFYCIRDKWNDSHYDLMFFIKAGIGVVIFFCFGIAGMVLVEKILKEKK